MLCRRIRLVFFHLHPRLDRLLNFFTSEEKKEDNEYFHLTIIPLWQSLFLIPEWHKYCKFRFPRVSKFGKEG